jgi:hypothetical protein
MEWLRTLDSWIHYEIEILGLWDIVSGIKLGFKIFWIILKISIYLAGVYYIIQLFL